MKKIGLIVLLIILVLGFGKWFQTLDSEFIEDEFITVISREDGSGTRGAFVELVGLEEETEDGGTKDMTTDDAIISNKTDVVLTNVSTDPHAIGYCSLGSVNDTVKMLSIDGVTPSSETIKDGSYPIARPFNIVTSGELNELEQDFINFIYSAEGQAIVQENKYVPVVDNAPAFESTMPEGKIVIAGSSSVAPVMEKLQEAYLEINPNATIELQITDSSAGVMAVQEGTADIGMASRALKPEEIESGIEGQAIAMDGIVVIVNPLNPHNNMSMETLQAIYKGEITTWDAVPNEDL